VYARSILLSKATPLNMKFKCGCFGKPAVPKSKKYKTHVCCLSLLQISQDLEPFDYRRAKSMRLDIANNHVYIL
jgi:hypothetical protein